MIHQRINSTSALEATKLTTIKNSEYYKKKNRFTKTIEVVGTIYYPVAGQCDADPLVTADMTRVNPHKVKEQRIVALSRNLIKRWGGNISYGDTILVTGGASKEYLGEWYVHDTMNERFEDYLDFMVPKGTRLVKFDSLIIKVKT